MPWITEPDRGTEALEEGVRDEVEERCRPRARRQAEEHVPELAHGRVREHLLDVALHERRAGADQRGERGHAADREQHPGHGREQRVQAQDE
jgi:hypothetical protein